MTRFNLVLAVTTGSSLLQQPNWVEVAAEIHRGWSFVGPCACPLATSAVRRASNSTGAHFCKGSTPGFPSTRRADAFAFTNQTKQGQVLVPMLVVAKLTCFFEREFPDSLGPRRKGEFRRPQSRSPAIDFFDFNRGVLEMDSPGFQNLGGHTVPRRSRPSRICSVPTKLWPRRRGPSWANMMTLDGLSVKRSNILAVPVQVLNNLSTGQAGGRWIRGKNAKVMPEPGTTV